MKSVLYVCHGSRMQVSCKQAMDLIGEIQGSIPIRIQEISFLELAEPTIEMGFERCIERGATEVAVVPVFLFAASHVKNDIPKKLEGLKKRNPNVSVSFGKVVGLEERIIDILLERVNEKTMDRKESTAVLIVGRGSSDPDIKSTFTEVARLFHNRSNYRDVKPCFLAAAEPGFKELLYETLDQEGDTIIIIPYLLFPGVLTKEMKMLIDGVSSEKTIFLCDVLGFHPHLKEVLINRVVETLQQKDVWMVSS
ncbi:sirohydrochlorin chelatase [Pseudalkalibacillus salsuginis]|uniref:sirohydrochlorin chelatase n=1 Tax=Pseudalkalibacillus salsuginis TaxID=2910972 RepID=UPI001F420DC2|nr:sirohydrochlorin chelatase [Pseudalkalibacillus salsuginis]MCF6411316.1 sirohydrochlorin chelatase [Pseudalkalibacillus salsuginis]